MAKAFHIALKFCMKSKQKAKTSIGVKQEWEGRQKSCAKNSAEPCVPTQPLLLMQAIPLMHAGGETPLFYSDGETVKTFNSLLLMIDHEFQWEQSWAGVTKNVIFIAF